MKAVHGCPFGPLLAQFRARVGRSCNSLALEVGVNPSYLTRIECGGRNPPRRHIVEAIARGLRLKPYDCNRLLVAAGYSAVSDWTQSLQMVTESMRAMDEGQRAQFLLAVELLARNWMRDGD